MTNLKTESRPQLKSILSVLTEEEIEIMVLTYQGHGLTQAEVAVEVGCSQQQVSIVLDRILEKARFHHRRGGLILEIPKLT